MAPPTDVEDDILVLLEELKPVQGKDSVCSSGA